MTMTFIASATGAGTAVFFDNIPQTFTHLQVRLSVRGLNASATSNLYSAGGPASHALQGDGSSASSSNFLALPYQFVPNAMPAASATSGIFSSWVVDILDYTNTNKFKTYRFLGGFDANGSGRVTLASGYWNTLNALTSIWFDTEGGFHTGSRLHLYGISTSSVTGA